MTYTKQVNVRDILALATKLNSVALSLEVEALDMVTNSKKYAAGEFPDTHMATIANSIEGLELQIKKVKQSWINLVLGHVDVK